MPTKLQKILSQKMHSYLPLIAQKINEAQLGLPTGLKLSHIQHCNATAE
jgi:hypothetical protein